MNRAQRRLAVHRIAICGTRAPEKEAAVLEITEADRDLYMPHIEPGEVIIVHGRCLVGGKLQACEPGEETPMRIEIKEATAKPN